MLTIALAAAALGPLKTFGDWAVGCDNVHRCEMTSLEPDDGPNDTNIASLLLEREPRPIGSLRITVVLESHEGANVALVIDGARIASARTIKGAARFTGAEALRIATALATGKRATIGPRAAKISLKGAAAALRFVDAEQGRAGSVTALVARGDKPASAVPAATPLPIVRSIVPGGKAAPLPRALLAQLNRASGCAAEYDVGFPQPPAETAALGGGATLVLLPCGAGAYNIVSVAFVLRGGKAAPAIFDSTPRGLDGSLTNASWDAQRGTLSSHAKARGIGDCGEAADYVWDGARFRATEVRRMDECRGSGDWLTLWRATVRR